MTDKATQEPCNILDGQAVNTPKINLNHQPSKSNPVNHHSTLVMQGTEPPPRMKNKERSREGKLLTRCHTEAITAVHTNDKNGS